MLLSQPVANIMDFTHRQTHMQSNAVLAPSLYPALLPLRLVEQTGARRYQFTTGGPRQGLTNRDGGWQRVPPAPRRHRHSPLHRHRHSSRRAQARQAAERKRGQRINSCRDVGLAIGPRVAGSHPASAQGADPG